MIKEIKRLNFKLKPNLCFFRIKNGNYLFSLFPIFYLFKVNCLIEVFYLFSLGFSYF